MFVASVKKESFTADAKVIHTEWKELVDEDEQEDDKGVEDILDFHVDVAVSKQM